MGKTSFAILKAFTFNLQKRNTGLEMLRDWFKTQSSSIAVSQLGIFADKHQNTALAYLTKKNVIYQRDKKRMEIQKPKSGRNSCPNRSQDRYKERRDFSTPSLRSQFEPTFFSIFAFTLLKMVHVLRESARLTKLSSTCTNWRWWARHCLQDLETHQVNIQWGKVVSQK